MRMKLDFVVKYDMKKLHFPSHLSRVESFCLITLSQIHFESFLCLQTRNPQALLSQKNGMDEVVKFSQQNFLFLRPTTSKLTFFIFTIFKTQNISFRIQKVTQLISQILELALPNIKFFKALAFCELFIEFLTNKFTEIVKSFAQ